MPALKRIREMLIEKNRIFEEQGPGALDKMMTINVELNEIMEFFPEYSACPSGIHLPI
jgi:hypothetical protein